MGKIRKIEKERLKVIKIESKDRNNVTGKIEKCLGVIFVVPLAKIKAGLLRICESIQEPRVVMWRWSIVLNVVILIKVRMD